MTMMVVAFVSTYFLGVSAMLIILVCLGIGLVDLFLDLKKNNAYQNKENKKGRV